MTDHSTITLRIHRNKLRKAGEREGEESAHGLSRRDRGENERVVMQNELEGRQAPCSAFCGAGLRQSSSLPGRPVE